MTRVTILTDNPDLGPKKEVNAKAAELEQRNKGKQFRCFMATCNNPLPVHKDMLLDLAFSYAIIGHEVGESGTPHFQCYVEMQQRIGFGKLRHKLPNYHVEERRGTQKQAIDYCKKEGNFEEYGTPKRNAAVALPLTDFVKKIQYGLTVSTLFDQEEEVTSTQVRMYETLVKYYEPKRDSNEGTSVTWIFGESGTGKTRMALERLPHSYLHHGNLKWWEGYDGHREVIIDDFRPGQMVDYETFLGLIDRHEFRVETKGGSRQMRAVNFYLTSLQDPETMFRDYFQNLWYTRKDISEMTAWNKECFEKDFQREYEQVRRRLTCVKQLKIDADDKVIEVQKPSLLSKIFKKRRG